MGQKVNPHGMRVGINKDWSSRWFTDKKVIAAYIKEDDTLRKYIKQKYYQAALSSIIIERNTNSVTIDINTGRPGVLIGKGGSGIEDIKADLKKIVKDKELTVNIIEVKKPDGDAQLIAENIAAQLEKRIAFRRAMRQCMGRAMRSGIKGIKTMVSGRLDGAEIARCEHYHEGSIPLHTLRADIDYGFAQAKTTFGIIGVKVWIYHGEILSKKRVGGNADVNA